MNPQGKVCASACCWRIRLLYGTRSQRPFGTDRPYMIHEVQLIGSGDNRSGDPTTILNMCYSLRQVSLPGGSKTHSAWQHSPLWELIPSWAATFTYPSDRGAPFRSIFLIESESPSQTLRQYGQVTWAFPPCRRLVAALFPNVKASAMAY